MRVRYFGEFNGPNAKKWDDNVSDRDGNRTGDPVSMWHNFSFKGQLREDWFATLSPRFYTVLGDRNDLAPGKDPHTVLMDDWVLSLQKVWYRDAEFTLSSRIGARAPFSSDSRMNRVDGQGELEQSFGWTPRPELSFKLDLGYRQYVYEPGAKQERYRLNESLITNYIVNDRWAVQLYHELDMQHRSPTRGDRAKKWNYVDRNKHLAALGVGYSFTPNLSVMPYVKELNDDDIRPETMQVGFWVFGTIL